MSMALKVRYMHSDVDTVERIETDPRSAPGRAYDILVGINLLREGLDIPECGLVAILDADKEGFLRSRNEHSSRPSAAPPGMPRLAKSSSTPTRSPAPCSAPWTKPSRRRTKQIAYNEEHGITPKTIERAVADILADLGEKQGASGKGGKGAKTKTRGKGAKARGVAEGKALPLAGGIRS